MSLTYPPGFLRSHYVYFEQMDFSAVPQSLSAKLGIVDAMSQLFVSKKIHLFMNFKTYLASNSHPKRFRVCFDIFRCIYSSSYIPLHITTLSHF